MANLANVLDQLETLYKMAKGLLPDVAKQLATMRNDLLQLQNDINKMPVQSRAAALKALDDIVNFIHPKTDAFIKNRDFSQMSQLQLDAQNAQKQIELLKANVAANLANANKSAKSATPAAPTPLPAPSKESKAKQAPKNIFGNMFSGKESKSPLLQAVYDLVKSLVSLFLNFLGGKKKVAKGNAALSSTQASTNPAPTPSASPAPTPAPAPSTKFSDDAESVFKHQPRKSFPVSGMVRSPSGTLVKTHLDLDQQSDALYTTFGHGTINQDRYELTGLWNPHTGQQFLLRGQQTGRNLEISDLEYNGKKVSGEELLEIIKSSYVDRQYPKVKSMQLNGYAPTVETRATMVDGQLMQEQYLAYPSRPKKA